VPRRGRLEGWHRGPAEPKDLAAATCCVAEIRNVVEKCWSGAGSVLDPWAPLTWRRSRRLGYEPKTKSCKMIRFFAKRFRSWIDYTVVVEANVMALDDELMARGSESWILQIPRTSKQRVTRAKVGGPKTFEREWI
jgi:hypothetical protein